VWISSLCSRNSSASSRAASGWRRSAPTSKTRQHWGGTSLMWPPCHTHRERSFPVLSPILIHHTPCHVQHRWLPPSALPTPPCKCTQQHNHELFAATSINASRAFACAPIAPVRSQRHHPQRAGKHTTRSCAVPTPHRTDGGQPRLTHATSAFPTSNNLPPPPSAQARCTHDVRLCADSLPTRFQARVRDDRYDSFAVIRFDVFWQ
jgi:hypothetical protein